MSHLLPSEKLEEQLPKLLPGVLALYKKHAETVHVSKVCTVWLRASVAEALVGCRPQRGLRAELESQAPGLTGPPSWHRSLLAPARGWCPAGRLS